MENPLLARVIGDLPLLLGDANLVRHLLERAHAQIHWNVVSLGEVTGALQECERMDGLLLVTSLPSAELVAHLKDCVHILQHQRRQLNAALAVLVVIRAVNYARSRSRLVPGVLLAAASAAVVPGFRSFTRFSILMLGSFFASGRPHGGVQQTGLVNFNFV